MMRCEKPDPDRNGEESEQGRDQKDGPDAGGVGDQPEHRRQDAERQIEEGGIDAHSEPARSGRRARHRLHAEARIDERITEAGERGPGEAEPGDGEGRPDNRHDEHFQAEREISQDGDIVEGDDLPSLDAVREAAREHSDAFIVKSDLEDADQREATPGVREQP